MVGLIFQSWFILFISLLLYFNDSRVELVKDLSIFTLISATIFSVWQGKKNKQIESLESYLFLFSSLGLILYTSIIGMILLPDAIFERQENYLRLIFYSSILLFFILQKMGFSKNLLVFYSVIASSQIYLYRYHYSSIAILFYLVINLYLLKKFSLSKKNIFDLLVFLLLTASIISTYTSFYYNGTNAVFGFFHVLSGILLYLYFKYLNEEDDVLDIVRFNIFFYAISLILCLTLIFFVSKDPNSKASLAFTGFRVDNLGGLIAVNLPTIIVISIFFKDKFKVFYVLLILLSLPILYWTDSPGSALGVAISSLFLVLYSLKSETIQNKKIALILVLFLLFVFFSIGKFFFQTGTMESNFVFARISIWGIYIDRVLNHSILFGFGSNNENFNTLLPINYLSDAAVSDLRYYFTKFQLNPNSRNLYIQFFYNYGLYGLSILVAIFFFVIVSFLKKVVQKNINRNELLAYSALVSIFFQEIFEYTMLDAMTFFPTAFALGIISRYSYQLNSFEYLKSFSTVNIKFIYALQIFIAFFISLLGFNLCVSEKVKTLFKNEFSIDNFSNLSFKDNSVFTEVKLKTFRKLDGLYLPINLDDKKEQFSGQVYLEAYKIYNEKKDLDLAEKNFQKCILIFPNSAICYKKLEEIELLKKNPDTANEYLKKSKDNDPFGLVN